MRFVPPANLCLHIKGCTAKLTILDISLGGVGVEATAPLARGEYELTLTLGKTTFVRRARAIYCRGKGDARWTVGMEFLEDRGSGPTIGALIDRLTETLIRFS
jgi:hypothetical protein